MTIAPLDVQSNVSTIAAVLGTNTVTDGVGLFGLSPSNGIHGKSTGDGKGSSGVFGEAVDGPGVAGQSNSSVGVDARSNTGPAALRAVYTGIGGPGVLGVSPSNGVHGKSTGDGKGSSGVFGEAIDGPGVSGQSERSVGVDAKSTSGQAALRAVGTGATVGALGQSNSGVGVFGVSQTNDGVRAESTSGNGLSAFSQTGTGIFAKGPVNAGFFEGNVAVTGDITLGGGDCAEDFDVVGSGDIEPGTVMVMNEEGALREGRTPYDSCVAGVVCGAGDYRPGLILDRRQTVENRIPVALLGKVACKVDAGYGAIEVGDLLTTSHTPGHAMKATDRERAFGSVIGKALRPQREGRGIIPVLVALQ
jgi:hypothetical protein